MNNESLHTHQEQFKKGLFEWITSMSKTIAAITILFGGVWVFLGPVITPYIEVPQKLDAAISDLNTLSIKVSDRDRIEFIAFKGVGVISNQSEKEIEIVYLLNKKVGCNSSVIVRFFDVDKGYFTYSKRIVAVNNPVSKEYIPFKISVEIPKELVTGRYMYMPIIEPEDCGVYTSVAAPASEIFTVKRKPDVSGSGS